MCRWTEFCSTREEIGGWLCRRPSGSRRSVTRARQESHVFGTSLIRPSRLSSESWKNAIHKSWSGSRATRCGSPCNGTPRAPIPDIVQEHDPAFRRINTPVEVWRVSATRMVDNFLDITHFPFVHVGTFGREQDTHVPRFELQSLDDGYYGYRYQVMANNTTGALVSGQTQQVVHREMSSGFSLPFVVRSTIR